LRVGRAGVFRNFRRLLRTAIINEETAQVNVPEKKIRARNRQAHEGDCVGKCGAD
jgi:hypothetical protein